MKGQKEDRLHYKSSTNMNFGRPVDTGIIIYAVLLRVLLRLITIHKMNIPEILLFFDFTVLFYKIKNNLIDLEFPSSIQPAPRSGIQHAMLQPYSSVLAHSYSPFVRTVRVWNKLSTQTVQAKNITSFKSLAMWDIQNMKTPNHLKRL